MTEVTNCYFCNHKFGLLETYYVIRMAMKPPGSAFRWKNFSKCCESCSETNELNIDRFKTGESK